MSRIQSATCSKTYLSCGKKAKLCLKLYLNFLLLPIFVQHRIIYTVKKGYRDLWCDSSEKAFFHKKSSSSCSHVRSAETHFSTLVTIKKKKKGSQFSIPFTKDPETHKCFSCILTLAAILFEHEPSPLAFPSQNNDLTHSTI